MATYRKKRIRSILHSFLHAMHAAKTGIKHHVISCDLAVHINRPTSIFVKCFMSLVTKKVNYVSDKVCKLQLHHPATKFVTCNSNSYISVCMSQPRIQTINYHYTMQTPHLFHTITLCAYHTLEHSQ